MPAGVYHRAGLRPDPVTGDDIQDCRPRESGDPALSFLDACASAELRRPWRRPLETPHLRMVLYVQALSFIVKRLKTFQSARNDGPDKTIQREPSMQSPTTSP